MVARKKDERESIDDELRREGIHYQPMVASHFGSLHPALDSWISALAKGCGRRRGWARKAVERQIRARLGAAFARRMARMSLATWGREAMEGDVLLPIVEYDDLDRTAAVMPVEPPGTGRGGTQPDSLCAAMSRITINIAPPHREWVRG